ncbi:hypothetical protein Ancab_016401 [Ancistrocladus abbreviatus]
MEKDEGVEGELVRCGEGGGDQVCYTANSDLPNECFLLSMSSGGEMEKALINVSSVSSSARMGLQVEIGE